MAFLSYKFIYLTHEVNSGLSFIKCSGRNVNIEHHFPLGWPHRLMETEPHLTTSTQWVIIVLRTKKILKIKFQVSNIILVYSFEEKNYF